MPPVVSDDKYKVFRPQRVEKDEAGNVTAGLCTCICARLVCIRSLCGLYLGCGCVYVYMCICVYVCVCNIQVRFPLRQSVCMYASLYTLCGSAHTYNHAPIYSRVACEYHKFRLTHILIALPAQSAGRSAHLDCAFTYTLWQTHRSLHTYTLANTHEVIYIYAHIHTYTHTYIHTCLRNT